MTHDTAETSGAAPAAPAPDGTATPRPGRPAHRRWSARRHAPCLGGGAVVALVLVLGAVPGVAQWRAGQSPGAGVATTAATLEDYARMLQATEERLRLALGVLVGHGVREYQEGAMPPALQALLDEAQTALVVVRNAPGDFRGSEAYEAAERRLRDSIAAMRSASAPTAAAEAQEIQDTVAGLRLSAAAAARNPTAAGGPAR